jgi:hypothetical protein
VKVVLALFVVAGAALFWPRAAHAGGADSPAAPSDVRVVVDGMGRFRLEWRDNSGGAAPFEARVEILDANGASLYAIDGAAEDAHQASAYIYGQTRALDEGCYTSRLSVTALASAGRRSAPAVAEASVCVDGEGTLSFPDAGEPAYLPAAPTGLRVVSDPVAGPVLVWRDNSNDETYFDAVMRVVAESGDEVLARIDIAFTGANVTTTKLPPTLNLTFLKIAPGCYGAMIEVHARGVDGAESHPAEASEAICFDERGAMTFPDAPAPGAPPSSPDDVRLVTDGAGWYRIAWNDNSSDEAHFDAEVRFEAGGAWVGTMALAPIAANATSAMMPRNDSAFGRNACYLAILRVFAVGADGATSLPAEHRETACIDGVGGITLPALGFGMDDRDDALREAWIIVLTLLGLTLVALGVQARNRRST